jgi:hypothetical protein
MNENSNGSGSRAEVIRLEAGRALSALTALQNISNRFDDKTPFLDSYTVARLLNRLTNHPDIQATDKARRDLIMKFGEKDDATGNVRITAFSPGFAKYVEEYQPIADEMLELEIKRLNPKTLKHVIGVQPADALALFPLMEEISEEMDELSTEPPPAPAQATPMPTPMAMPARR